MQEETGDATTSARQAKGANADSLSFDRGQLLQKCRHRLQVSYGLAEINAERFAQACIDELSGLYSGTRIYIPKRIIDRDEIRQQHSDGVAIEKIARRHGIATRTVRRIIIR